MLVVVSCVAEVGSAQGHTRVVQVGNTALGGDSVPHRGYVPQCLINEHCVLKGLRVLVL